MHKYPKNTNMLPTRSHLEFLMSCGMVFGTFLGIFLDCQQSICGTRKSSTKDLNSRSMGMQSDSSFYWETQWPRPPRKKNIKYYRPSWFTSILVPRMYTVVLGLMLQGGINEQQKLHCPPQDQWFASGLKDSWKLKVGFKFVSRAVRRTEQRSKKGGRISVSAWPKKIDCSTFYYWIARRPCDWIQKKIMSASSLVTTSFTGAAEGNYVNCGRSPIW